METGIWPAGSYHGGNVDTVDLMSGNLNLRIPLFDIPQKGNLSLSFSVVMNNPQYNMTEGCDTIDVDEDDGSGTLTTVPETTCWNYYYLSSSFIGPQIVFDQMPLLEDADQTITVNGSYELAVDTYTLADPSGSTHTFGWDASNPNILRANDGSGYSWIPTTTEQGQYVGLHGGTVSDPSGTTYAISTDSNGVTLNPGVITDTYQNSITVQAPSGAGGYSGWGLIVDTQNNQVPYPANFTTYTRANGLTSGCPNLGMQNQPITGSYAWQVPGANGSPVQYLICTTAITYSTDFTGQGFPSDGVGYAYSEAYSPEPITVIQSIVLPNKTYWGFVYDTAGDTALNPSLDTLANLPVGYGALTELIYPTGGSISYDYETDQPCSYGYNGLTRNVKHRYLNDNTGNNSEWIYTYKDSLPDSSGHYTTTITDPLSNDTVHQFSRLLVPNYAPSCNLAETGTLDYSGSASDGLLVQTMNTVYHFVVSPQNVADDWRLTTATNILPTQVTKITPSGTTTTNYSYPTLFTDEEYRL